MHITYISGDFPKISLNICFLELSKNCLGTRKRVGISKGKRAIGIRVIGILMYMQNTVDSRYVDLAYLE